MQYKYSLVQQDHNNHHYSVNLFVVNIQLFQGRFNAHKFHTCSLLSSFTIGKNKYLHSFQIIVSDFVVYTDYRT